MPVLTIYTTPSCQQCRATKRYIKKLGGDFNAVDITTDEQAHKMLKDMGMTSAPVVETPSGEFFSGFQPTKLKEIFSTAPAHV